MQSFWAMLSKSHELGQRSRQLTHITKDFICSLPSGQPWTLCTSLHFPMGSNLLNVDEINYVNQVSLSWDSTRVSSMFSNLWSYYYYKSKCLMLVFIISLSLSSQTEFQMDDRQDGSRDWQSRKANRLNNVQAMNIRVIFMLAVCIYSITRRRCLKVLC